jgi:Rrf2 family iron-sulfur cluster assembly transcriptional regulator
MRISTKGRYALRVMIDLAEQGGEARVPLRDIAARQDISEKYLESIIATLNKAGLVDATRGKNGGYRLSRLPGEYTAGEILRTAEGSLSPVSCLDSDSPCERAGQCRTLPLWEGLDRVIDEYLDHYTLADLTRPRE